MKIIKLTIEDEDGVNKRELFVKDEALFNALKESQHFTCKWVDPKTEKAIIPIDYLFPNKPQ